jgi:hypothetical protein
VDVASLALLLLSWTYRPIKWESDRTDAGMETKCSRQAAIGQVMRQIG